MGAKDKEAIAIVGIGCRFPGRVLDVDSFWSLLIEGKSGIRDVPADRWNAARFYHPDRSVPGKLITPRGGYLDRADQFDAAFFGISPREANRMDPQQRWLLEVAWEALEDGGVAPVTLRGSQTGVFVGISGFDYATIQTTNGRGTDVHSASGMALSIAANRLSYWFDLRGPSLAVDTACSSALVALHLACESIRNGESEMALAGGVNALLTPGASIAFSKAGMLSPDGECYAFDSRANGFVRAEGAGLVLIKRLSRALADQDRIYAVIRSTASNQDGRTPAMAVPGEAAQIALLRSAYDKADIDPAHVAYMEAHGTGTPVGDPIETAAIGKVLSKGRVSDAPCRIGSVKTNIGHLESASGIAGLIKAALVIDRQTIPPNRNFEKPNPAIAFDDLNLRVVTQAEPLLIAGCRPIVGVNSFGFGGTNAHAVLEAAPDHTTNPDPRHVLADRPFVLPLSARGDVALRALAQKFRHYLTTNHPPLSDICYSAGERREHHPNRLVVVGRDSADLRHKLDTWLTAQSVEGITVGLAAEKAEQVTFVYSGQGGQWWRMGRDLLRREPIFRAAIEEIDVALRPLTRWSLLEEMLRDEEDSNIRRTDIAQPAIFALQVGLTHLWKSWGISPQRVIGHSVGEVAAALAAGVLDLEDAVKVIFHRSRLQHQTAGNGGMAAVGLSEAKARKLVANTGPRLEIAAVNSPSLVTLAADATALSSVLETLESEGVFVRRLPIDYAFHSYQMDSIRDELLSSLADIRPVAADIPIVSTVTGAEIDGSQMGAEYWWSNVRQPVRFAPGIEACSQEAPQVFIELGPHASLESSVKETLGKSGASTTVVSSLRRGTDESLHLLNSLAQLHLAGVRFDWASLSQSDGCFVRLPSYPWTWKSFWLQSTESKKDLLYPEVTPLLGVQVLSAIATWESEPDPRRFEYLQDHRIWNSIVFPGAGFADMALALVRHLHPNSTHVIEDLQIEQALFISNDSVTILQTVYDEKESSFAIFSSGEDRAKWERHASGHITKLSATERKVTSIAALQSQLSDQIDHEEIYQKFSDAGFQFGNSFRNIRKLWRGTEQALAEIVAPDSIGASLAGSCFHPVLLDACIQATTGLIPPGAAGQLEMFLPASFQRIQLCCEQVPQHFFAQAVNPRWGNASLTADIFVIGIDGEAVAEIRGFKSEKFAQRRAAGEIPVSMFQYQWRPGHLWGSRANEPPNLASPHDIAAVARQRVAGVSKKYDIDRLVRDIVPQLERIVCLYVENAYRKLDWTPEGDFGLDAAMSGLGAVERYRGLVKVQLDAIARYTGAVSVLGDNRWHVNQPWSDEDVGKSLDRLRETFPPSDSESILLAAVGPQLADILCGLVDPLSILFPGGSSELVDPFYSRSTGGRAYNELIQAAITEALKAVPEGRAIRVLEVGGGTGSLTRGILPILPSHKTEYTFSDLSPAFFVAARQHFSKFPFVKYQPFDIERAPQEQDIPVAGFDIIVAGDVIHATSSLSETLENLKKCLAPGGILLFLELSRSLALIENTFGLLEGWWKFSDCDLRKSSPVLAPDKWRQVLLQQDFEDVQHFVNLEQNESEALQTVYVARVPEVALVPEQNISKVGGFLGKKQTDVNNRVIIFADHNGVGAAMAKELRAKGMQTLIVQSNEVEATVNDNVLKIDPGSEEAIRAFVSEHFPSGSSPLGIVDCWSLDSPAPPLNDDNADILASQVAGLQHIRRLLRVVVELWPKALPKLTVVTRGGQCVHESEGNSRIDSAPVVGFLRVARNEYPETTCLHIDLDPAVGGREIDDLIAELTLTDNETEVAFRQGRRYVHRLHEVDEDSIPPRLTDARGKDGSLTSYRLELGKPGSTHNVSLNASARRTPAAGEMEIEIKAAGINFRDVMKTLGMYPGTPVENRQLGDDFSGIVSRIGNGVAGFSVGDPVFGSTVLAFSSHAIVRPEMVSHKPDFASFVEAAGLPTVFLTAHYALIHLAQMQPKERVLIHAGAGGVGQAAIQVAKALGLEIFATAGTPERRELLKKLGATHTMDSRSLRFADDVMAATSGEGVDAVLNSLSGDFIAKNLSVLAPFGRMIEIGKIDIYGDTKIGLSPFRKNISFCAVDLDLVINKKPAFAAQLAREVYAEIAAGRYKPLPIHSFPVTEASNAMRLMAQAKHAGKIVLDFDLPSIPIAPALDDSIFFRPDAFYLITGGASGVGLELALWMQRCGARHFALLSRSGPRDERDVKAIEELRAAGAEVLDIRGDVTNLDDVNRAIEQANRPDVPLRGIFHCAMVLNDQFISELDDERFNRTLYPKMVGAWNLHVSAREVPLDHFVCFSSFSAALGLPRQANYNAGNSFLSGLTKFRRAKGMPGLTIEWGAIQGAGTLEREAKVGQFLGQLGVQGISLVDLFRKLRYAMTRDTGVVAFAKMDWMKLASLAPQVRSGKTFELVSVTGTKRRRGGWVREELANVGSHGEARDILVNYLTGRVAEILGTDAAAIEVLKPFSQLGIDSLMAVELVQGVEADLDLTLGMGAILGGSRLADLADSLARKLRSDLNADEQADKGSDAELGEQMVEDTQIADSIYFRRGAGRSSANGRVLLTGATGFLGAYVLKELLLRETSEIVCIIRAEGPDVAIKRIRNNLKKYGLLEDESALQRRIKVVLGDLSKPRFGLTQEEFDGLAACVDAVYHLAAEVNHLLDYQSLRGGNVLSTKHILEFVGAADHRIEVHYASSIAIFSNFKVSGSAKVTELDAPSEHPDVTSGYVQTKWVSEHLFIGARERGCPVTIYRFGLITGDVRAGTSNPADFLWRSVKVMLDMRKAPDSNSLLYITPVDFAARAMVSLSLTNDAENQTYHVIGDTSTGLSDVLDVAKTVGLDRVDLIPVDEWIATIANRLNDAEVQSIAPYLAAYPEGPQIAASPIMELLRFPAVSNALTRKKLAEHGIAVSTNMPALVAMYLKDLTDVGSLEQA